MATGKIVTTTITRAELNPVILTPITIFAKRILRVTIAIDRPKERTTLSITFICRKKTKVQAKPGRKNTNRNPSIALRMSTCSRIGKANSKIPLIGDSQSVSYLPI